MAQISIRKAAKRDREIVFGCLKDLASYEHLEHKFQLSLNTIAEWIENGKVNVLIAEIEKAVAGIALYYYTYSTFSGKAGIYLEDFFVFPVFRKMGAGTELFTYLKKIAKAEKLAKIEWKVLDWNESAICFYKKQGAKKIGDWVTYSYD